METQQITHLYNDMQRDGKSSRKGESLRQKGKKEREGKERGRGHERGSEKGKRELQSEMKYNH